MFTDGLAQVAKKGVVSVLDDAKTEYRSLWTWLREVEFCQRWIDVDGVSTRIAEAGDAASPAVVLLQAIYRLPQTRQAIDHVLTLVASGQDHGEYQA